MMNQSFNKRIKPHIEAEIEQAAKLTKADDLESAFHHLERAHILGQVSAAEHTKVHWLMLKVGWKKRDWREIFGQLFRIVGASTKTPFGIYPTGNTGGANVSPFKPMPVPPDLQAIIKGGKSKGQ